MKYQKILDNFTKDMTIIENDIQSANVSKMMLEKEIVWYYSFDYKGEKLSRKKLEEMVKTIRSDYNEVKVKIYTVGKKQNNLQSKLNSIYNPLYWVNKEQINLRKEIHNLEISKSELEIKEKDLEKVLYTKENEILVLQKDEEKYLSFDLNEKKETKNKLQNYIKEKKELLKPLEENYRRIKNKIEPLVKDINKKSKEYLKCTHRIDSAKYYCENLTLADNSYERAMIHQECESDLGDPSPQRVLNHTYKKEKGLKNSIKKLDERICWEIKKLSKVIDYIVIDGNNLCYSSNSEFIGLDPVVAVANELSKDYNVLVCFDNNIKHLLHCDKKEIKKRYNEKIEIHVVEPHHKADYTILELVERKKNSYVISNDRFADFPDKRVKKENLILTHEIVEWERQVLISDMDFMVKY